MSPHVEYVGDDISASTTASTAYCAGPGGSPEQSWTWSPPPGPVVSGCTEDAPTCVVLATAGTSGWSEECIDGSAWVGGWESCDYYGVVGGAPTISASVSPGSIAPDGQSTTTATAVVSDGGTPESGDAVSFSSSDPGQSIGPVTDHGDGTYTATITASKTAGNATITVTDATPGTAVTATTTLTSVGGVRNAEVTVSCLPQTPGSLADTCTVTVADVSGQTPAQTPTGAVTVVANAGQVTNGGSCGSVTSSTGSFTCTVGYTPPIVVGGMASPPVVTASYLGDTSFAPATGTESITCTSGAVFQLDSVTSSAPSVQGFEIDEPATLHGCGLTANTRARFGADDAEVTPSAANVAADGTTMTVNVPELAITGPLSITDGSQAVSRTTTLATPNPLPINSWRNTDGFSFTNHAGSLTDSDFLDEFQDSSSSLTLPGPGSVLRPWAEALYLNAAKQLAGGLCFGMALTSGEFADGSRLPSSLQAGAQTGFAIQDGYDLDQFLAKQWLSQDSTQALRFYQQGQLADNGDAVKTQLSTAMGPASGFQTPAIVGGFVYNSSTDRWEGHAEVAYGWDEDGGTLRIHTADSNVPFSDDEYTDTTDKSHEAALATSWIKVTPTDFRFPHEGFHSFFKPDPNAEPRQFPGFMIVYPIKELEGALTLNRTTFVHQLGLSVDPESTVGSVTSAGQPLSLSQPSAKLTLVPQITSAAAPDQSGSGLDQLVIAGSRATATLSTGAHATQALWQGAHVDAELTTSSGHVSTGFTPSSGQLTLSPVRGQSAPRTTTVSLTDQLQGDRSEQILTVTGPAHMSAALRAGQATVLAPAGGRFTVSLSSLGAGQRTQSAGLGTIAVAPGQMLTLTPRRWTNLDGASVPGRLSGGHRPARRMSLHSRMRVPTARSTGVLVRAKTVRVSVQVPRLPAQASHVAILVRATRDGRLLATGTAMARSGGRGHRATATITLRRTLPRGAHVTVTVETVRGGGIPTEGIAVRTIHIG